MTGKLAGGSIRILWDASDSAEVTITGGTAAWTVNGSAVTFPYTLSSSTTFETAHSGTYTVSVEHHGYEIAGTPDGTVEVSLRFGEQHVFEPTVDGPGHGASSVATQMTSLINDADSAPGAALRETFAAKDGTGLYAAQSPLAFASRPVVGYGNSYLQPQGASGNTTPWATLLTTERNATYANRGVNGYQFQDYVQTAIGQAGKVWAPNEADLVLVGDSINDVGRQQSDAQALAGYKEAVRALVYLLRASSRVESSLWTLGTGWAATGTAGDDLWLSDSTVAQGNNATGEATSPSFTTTVANELVGLLTYVKVNANGANIDVKLDGAVVESKATANVGRQTQLTARDYVPCVIPITVPTAGTHTVSVARTGGGPLSYVDALLRFEGSTFPTVVFQKAVRPTDAAYVSFYGAGKTDAARATYNTALDDVLAEFPTTWKLYKADANALAWDPVVHQSSDGLHPSAAGHQKLLSAAKISLGDLAPLVRP